MIRSVVVLGGGSAGLLAALTVRRRLPPIAVRVVRSPDLGIIGVGEGTTPAFPKHLHEYLRLSAASFFREAEPTFKLGIRLLWGPRPRFHYTFTLALEGQLRGLRKANGFFCDEEFDFADAIGAMMAADRAFAPAKNGAPAVHQSLGYHVENAKLVAWLEARARECAITITDGTVTDVDKAEDGIAALRLESGEEVRADLFIDASGFRSELLGRALGERYHDWSGALFCDRALIGGWARREGEPILPYTTAETMDAGWCWAIEHEHFVNRGYVFSSRALSDDDAHAEFLRKNPRANLEKTRVVRFRSGRHERAWVGNVLALGNAYGFVEPLEATALMVLSVQLRSFCDALADADRTPSPILRTLFNRLTASIWDETRDFLALHYRFNTRLETPFWQAARAETPLGGAEEIVEFYRAHGPSLLAKQVVLPPQTLFGYEGYLVHLVGNQVPHARRYLAGAEERALWERQRAQWRAAAQAALDMRATLAAMRSPSWHWP